MKLTDFGFAKRVTDRTYSLCGTPEYMAPEVLRSQGHSYGADWWSLGVLIFEMLTGNALFASEDAMTTIEMILSDDLICFPAHVELDAIDLIVNLVQHDLTQRFGCMHGGSQDIKQHRWFKSIDWHAIDAGTVVAEWRPPSIGAMSGDNFEHIPDDDFDAINDNDSNETDDDFEDLFADF